MSLTQQRVELGQHVFDHTVEEVDVIALKTLALDDSKIDSSSATKSTAHKSFYKRMILAKI
jgi:hypothetical protein